jgi:hypothetical protein
MVFGSPDTPQPRSPSTTTVDFFETRIRPVIAKNCYGCHGPDQQQSSLRVDSREALLKGGKRGPSIVPGEPERSLLVKAIRHDGLSMPIGSRLKEAEVAAIEEWIRRDASWPVLGVAKATSRKDRYAQLAREHWAFQPVSKPPVPVAHDSSWAKSDLDRFILARLQQSGLSPAKPADKRILMRRLSYILTGLPPAAEEMDRFCGRHGSGRVRPSGGPHPCFAALRRTLGPSLA